MIRILYTIIRSIIVSLGFLGFVITQLIYHRAKYDSIDMDTQNYMQDQILIYTAILIFFVPSMLIREELKIFERDTSLKKLESKIDFLIQQQKSND